MKPFGRYSGRTVYKIDLPTYIGNKYYDDELDMYLIHGDLIHKNQIIGRWDGKMVHEFDSHERSTFYVKTVKKDPEPEPKVEEPEVNVVAKPADYLNLETFTAASVDDILSGVYNWNL